MRISDWSSDVCSSDLRPLTRRADFADWAGHEAKVALKEKLDGRQRFNGTLIGIGVGIDGDVVTILDKEEVEHKLPFDAIDTAKLVLTDALIAATVQLPTEGADDMELGRASRRESVWTVVEI